MAPTDQSSVLLGHEWLARAGGSENVFEQMTLALPDARRIALWNDDPERFTNVHETSLARSPFRRNKASALPFMSGIWRRVDLTQVSKVIVSSHAFAHQLAGHAAAREIPAYAYVHSPARYIWAPQHDARGRNPFVQVASKHYRREDRSATHSAVRYVANSKFVQARIQEAWGQDAGVLYPPVSVAEIQNSLSSPLAADDQAILDSLPGEFVLGASRLIDYKRLDLAIEVAEILSLPAVIAGSGPAEGSLRRSANEARVPVLFAGRVSNRLLWALYQRASIFAFLATEDFGIMPLESIAAGTPALVYKVGGAWEGVSAVRGGAAARGLDRDALAEAAQHALAIDALAAQQAVQMFSNASFRKRIIEWTGQA